MQDENITNPAVDPIGRHCPGEEQRIFSTCVLQLQDTMGIPSLWQLKELHRRRALSAIRDRGALSAIRDRGALR